MQEYKNKEALITEIKATADLFIKEFEGLDEADKDARNSYLEWLGGFSEDELFKTGGRKWAVSTSSAWPIWKWVHINTVAPSKSFRGKIRKWKKLHSAKEKT